ncbi:paraquat-inducible protein A [Hyphomicrobium sulfonivorans]|uniref:paraquat-inducible protein A n=1 Tax=Hyphomicrobium sulfonivorans TaxID=121290 RepID=UPI00157085CD|nr:paraquat-inducible protein A [Hyphomicrobium sulfonivorans]MBI1650412.1 paraquat-inducible protein A [Hyphomicrobium sulfonivorans]NSL72227.1 paraquat-inducible protein A [Hyphomicrobium sulfonivorans]
MRIGGRRFLLSLAIIGAAVCLALGMTLPILRLTKFIFWTSEYSLLSTVGVLVQQGQTFLATVVFVFSILFPVVKLLYLLLISTLPAAELRRHSRRLKAIEWVGKWSMHDVLVLALTIFFLKSQGIYDAASLPAVYFFTAGVALMILSYAWLKTDVSYAAGQPPPLEMPRQLSAMRNFLLSFLIILATVFFALGIILPVIRFTTVYVWTNEHSIATIIWALYENSEYFLCAVVFAVSIFFPFLKLFYLLTLVTSPDLSPEFRRRSFSTMEWLGRYSMTDVMVLALMIFYVNSSGYTEAVVMPGVYFFAASAIITMLAYGWANTVPPRGRATDAAAALAAADASPGDPVATPSSGARPSGSASPEIASAHAIQPATTAPTNAAGQVVTLPTNPGRRYHPTTEPAE